MEINSTNFIVGDNGEGVDEGLEHMCDPIQLQSKIQRCSKILSKCINVFGIEELMSGSRMIWLSICGHIKERTRAYVQVEFMFEIFHLKTLCLDCNIYI